MSHRKTNKIESANDWQVAQFRLTVFPEASVNTKDIEWWQSTAGEAPESRTLHPRSGELREQGPLQTGVLSLDIRPYRIDWQFSRALPNDLPDDEFPTIGRFGDTLESFLEPTRKWLEHESPKLKRMAFGAVLLLPVESRESGYSLLSEYLPTIELDPEGSTDFMYQINRPRRSNLGISGLEINRLCKWSVIVFVNTMMRFDPRTRSSEQHSMPEAYACRLELDINTSAEFVSLLPQNRHIEIYEELVAFGREILEVGDTP